MVLTVSFALSSVTGLSCHRHSAELSSANLTPASGRQDHATSPSASGTLVSSTISVHRIPPHVDDVRNAPLLERDGDGYSADLRFGKTEIFFREGLDRGYKKQPDGQISCLALVLASHGKLLRRPMNGLRGLGRHGFETMPGRLRISASVAPWLLAHISAADAENLAT